MKKLLVLSLIIIYTQVAHAQILIGDVSSTPHPSAMLEVKPSLTTNAKGFRLPNLNSTQISNITSPATGLLVADISNNFMQYRGSSNWLTIPAFSTTAVGSSVFTHITSNLNTALNVSNGIGNGIEGQNSSQNATVYGVAGTVSSTFGGVGAAGVYGKNNTTGVNGYGVFGEHAGTGIGVYGKSTGGTAIFGQSNGVNAVGVSGSSTNGTAVFGTSTTGIAGDFESVSGGTALYTSGPLALRSIGEADGRVLTTDNVGIATWQDLPKIAFMAYTINTMYVVPFLTTQNCTFDATDFNVGNAFSTSTDRFTAPKSGIYHFDSRIDALVNTIVSGGVSTSFYYRIIIYNAGGISQNSYQSLIYPTTANNAVQYQLSIDAKMNSTDYAVVQISTTNGISVSIQPGKFTTFSGHYVCGL